MTKPASTRNQSAETVGRYAWMFDDEVTPSEMSMSITTRAEYRILRSTSLKAHTTCPYADPITYVLDTLGVHPLRSRSYGTMAHNV